MHFSEKDRNLESTAEELLNKLQKKFGPYQDGYGAFYRYGNHVVVCENSKFSESLDYLKTELNFNLLLDVCGVDNLSRPKEECEHGLRFESVYHFLNMETHQRLRMRVPLDEGESIDTALKLWKSADWFERESWDLVGIDYRDRKKERLLTHHEFIGHPLRKDYEATKNQPLSASSPIYFPPDETSDQEQGEHREWINIGPSHPATHGTLRVMAEVEGETIKRSKLEIGYLHRCFEKMCESHTYNQVIPYTDRLNYCSAPMNNIGWCKAIEDMMGIVIPERAQALRMVLAEFSRIIDHMVCVGTAAVDNGALTNFWYCFEQREKVYELFEKLCGARLTVSLTRIGGMSHEIPVGWISDCLDVIKSIKAAVEQVDKMLTRSKIWMDRTKVCAISGKEAINWGYTGPCLRACGINYDIRKTSPYYFYSDIDFEVPLGVSGDCYDRYLVRMEECRQSIKIIEQVLDNMPAGALCVDDKRVSLPSKKDVYTNIEGLMNHFMLVTQGVRPPVGEIYSATEAANGELGFYVISDGGPNPYRVKVRPPCFAIYQSFPEITQDYFIADAIACIGSMNVIAGELDR